MKKKTKVLYQVADDLERQRGNSRKSKLGDYETYSSLWVRWYWNKLRASHKGKLPAKMPLVNRLKAKLECCFI